MNLNLQQTFSLHLLQNNQTAFIQMWRTTPPTCTDWFKCHITIHAVFVWSLTGCLYTAFTGNHEIAPYLFAFHKLLATVSSGIWYLVFFSSFHHLLLAFSKTLWPFPHSRPTTWYWPLVRRDVCELKTFLWSLFFKVMPGNTSEVENSYHSND